MKKYEVTFEDFNHDRCVIEIEAWSKEEALIEVESELEQCYSALFAEECQLSCQLLILIEMLGSG